jgi:hypothetical protein
MIKSFRRISRANMDFTSELTPLIARDDNTTFSCCERFQPHTAYHESVLPFESDAKFYVQRKQLVKLQICVV